MNNSTTNTAPLAAPGLSATTSSLPQRGEGTERTTRPSGGDTPYNHNTRQQRSDWTLHQQSVSSSSNVVISLYPCASHHEAMMFSCNNIDENEKHRISAYCHNPYTSPTTTNYSPFATSHPALSGMGSVTAVRNCAPRHLRHRNPIFQEPVPPPPPQVASIDVPLPFPNVFESSPQQQRPMCCYFKQKGFCKMGVTCWYSHEGDLYAPCHYGASCKAGHATLVLMRENSSDAHNLQHPSDD
ncbi:Hypothetical protein, putative [Bodo saltans]|uniref:C3H1-type domain-containing protein n=1 Tax=Bodo saltans TaxID=75058 RepID=A0A0S4JNH2_BODSA|nr:Hypothetical protein, putative [Bodo saltans]|eukprot:CUG90666.1 Hypothetical protein, putative [Bodo saltans]